jgi:hypothetical protein
VALAGRSAASFRGGEEDLAVMMFPSTPRKTASKPSPDKRPRRRLPTGAPRLVESPSDRAARASVEAWEATLDVIRCSAAARLELFKNRSLSERVTCPWERLTGCAITCRCRGAGTVTIEFLTEHYGRLAAEIASLVSPSSALRRPS